jgi:hypothetical protein
MWTMQGVKEKDRLVRTDIGVGMLGKGSGVRVREG